MRHATLLFLVKRSSKGVITDVCLAMKKRGFGTGRWNGAGGKVAEGESVEQAAIRETKEEIGVTVQKMSKAAELFFAFSHNHPWDQMVHAYVATEWDGEPAESEEMNPKWFAVEDIPFSKMWPDDIFWLPRVISGALIKASFTFAEGDVILDQRVEEVASL
jgi:mutator protein MutT